MELKTLLRRIINTINYNEIAPDMDLSIDYVCDIVEGLMEKNVTRVTEDVIFPLMENYKAAEDNGEISYIKDTIAMVVEYLN